MLYFKLEIIIVLLEIFNLGDGFLFTNRQLSIIQILIEEKSFICGEDICSKIGIGLKTLQKEIKYIREALKEYQIFVISQKGKGYKLKMESKLQSEIFLNSISYFSKNEIQENYDDEYVLLSLIDKTILNDQTLTMSYLEDSMFVGRKYIKKLLGKISDYVETYNLKLLICQGRGIQLKGNIFQIQLLYVDLLEKIDNRFLYGKQFLNWRNDSELHLITQYFWDNKIDIPFMKVKKLCLFLSIQQKFKNKPSNYDLTYFDKKILESKLSRTTLDLCNIFNYIPNEEDELNISKMILCYLEKSQLSKYDSLLDNYDEIKRSSLEIIIKQVLVSGRNLFRISIDSISKSLSSVLIVNLIEQNLSIHEKFANIPNLGGKTMLCEFITADILCRLWDKFGIHFSVDVLANLKLILRSYTIKFSEINNQTIYVISRQDYSIAEYIAKNLEHEYLKDVKNITALSTLKDVILPDDIIVTDVSMENFIGYNNVLYFTSLNNYNEVKTSVGNYVNSSSKKSGNFFELLRMGDFNNLSTRYKYLSKLLKNNDLKNYKSQILKIDRMHQMYGISVVNNIAIIMMIDPNDKNEIVPLRHKSKINWDGTNIYLTFVIKIKKLSDFILFDAPLFKILNDDDFSSYLRDYTNSTEDFEQKLNEIVYS